MPPRESTNFSTTPKEEDNPSFILIKKSSFNKLS
jgi:hypothetical protein